MLGMCWGRGPHATQETTVNHLTKFAVLLLLLAAASTGCGTAQLTHYDAGAGKIDIAGSYMASISRARQLAIERCGGPARLVEPRDGRGQVAFACVDRHASPSTLETDSRSSGSAPLVTWLATN